ncbi:MAG: hypothetical protein FWD83_04260 [Promicromonosporaceae bacterium]|nr:hypothetical protein [Promicromonosporaceae bacterium]
MSVYLRACLAWLLALGGALATEDDASHSGSADADRGAFEVEVGRGASSGPTTTARGEPTNSRSGSYFRSPTLSCWDTTNASLIRYLTPATCDPVGGGFVTCPVDAITLYPLWVLWHATEHLPSVLAYLADGSCIQEAAVRDEAARAFATLDVPTPSATLQSGSWPTLLVGLWYPAYTNAAPIVQRATLLGAAVWIRAIPAKFDWDFDDSYSPGGSALATTEPGRPWVSGEPLPDSSWPGHAWVALGGRGWAEVTVTLRTTWRGQYRVEGGAWIDIPDEIVTVSQAGTFIVAEAHVRLIDDK